MPTKLAAYKVGWVDWESMQEELGFADKTDKRAHCGSLPHFRKAAQPAEQIPCNPKPLCRCISIAIVMQDGSQDFKCAGIKLVYTRFRPGLESKDLESILQVYTRYISFKFYSTRENVYDWDIPIPGIYFASGCHIPGISQVYSSNSSIPQVGIYLGYAWYIIQIYHDDFWGFQMAMSEFRIFTYEAVTVTGTVSHGTTNTSTYQNMDFHI